MDMKIVLDNAKAKIGRNIFGITIMIEVENRRKPSK